MKIQFPIRKCVMLLCALLVSCTTQPPKPVISAGAVAVPDEFAAAAAKEILEAGGNAVDAAIAIQFSLTVTLPEAGNIGGGGFMLIHASGGVRFIDYREMAPGAASRDMYLDKDGNVISGKSLVGALAAGVPGAVRGMALAHREFGSLPWAKLLEPAIRYAEQGFRVPAGLAQEIQEGMKTFHGKTNFAAYYGSARAGETFRQPELAETLKRIATDGTKEFYEGRTADFIVEEMKRSGGIISKDDLRRYEAKWREPVVGRWRDHMIVTAPPPSSGGVALIQLLKMKQALDDAFRGAGHNSGRYVHLVAEIEKRVFADRAHYLGDPDFVKVPVARLTSDEYCRERAKLVRAGAISPTEEIKPGPERIHTTHFSVVDKWGNAVSNTTTLNTGFGCGVVVTGAGFLLNNEMDDFSAKPGVPNVFGVVGADANAIQPYKRMLSSMSPTLVLRGDDLELVVGTPGGPTIFTSVFQVIVNSFDFGMPVERAVEAPRFHHQLLPKDQIWIEKLAPETAAELERLGYKLVNPEPIGDVHAIRIMNGAPQPASDPRGRGRALVVGH